MQRHSITDGWQLTFWRTREGDNPLVLSIEGSTIKWEAFEPWDTSKAVKPIMLLTDDLATALFKAIADRINAKNVPMGYELSPSSYDLAVKQAENEGEKKAMFAHLKDLQKIVFKGK